MDKDRVAGKMKDLGGKIERKIGELTNDQDTEAEGAGKQAEGKVQNAWGKVKDAARETVEDIKRKTEKKDNPDDQAVRGERDKDEEDVA